MLKKIFLIIPILSKLGYYNVAYMLWYRFSLKFGIRKRKFPLGKPLEGLFFEPTSPIINYPEEWKYKTIEKANNILEGKLTWFHYHSFQVGNPPNWFQNPFDGSVLNNHQKHWTELSDFDLNTGDVKILWEPSRLDWLTDLARAYRITGEEKYLGTINHWLQDWSLNNPKNQGPNWKCGQETAIRLMKLITTAQILAQDTNATQALKQLIFEHLERIAGNIDYAIAQDNNHGTSEAAGLYIGSIWLLKQKDCTLPTNKLLKWKRRGRKLLENRILRLIAPQGTFAQRSLTYHRVVIDTMSWVLYAMGLYEEPKFSKTISDRLIKLGEWQYKMISSDKGDGPNIGSNDGAMLETLHNRDYRDFRPSTELFFGVLKKKRVFGSLDCGEALFWRYPNNWDNMEIIEINQPKAEILDNQFLILRAKDTQIVIKIPSDQFRPSSCDAFHLDLWYKNENLLGDSGSYSYNAGEKTTWFKSVQAHNTVQFGDAQQMPKISRFLFGKWVNVNQPMILEVKDNEVRWLASYTDYRNNTHSRMIEWNEESQQILIADEVINVNNEPISIFFHLNSNLFNPKILMKTEEGEILSPKILTTEKSLYYLQKENRKSYVYKTFSSKITSTIDY